MKRIGIVLGLAVGIGLVHASPTRPAALSGLAAEWHFSEGGGTVAGDSSGNGVQGTLTNGPAWTSGRIGGGLSFDGTNDYVNLGTNVNLLNGVPAASVSLWIKPGSTLASGAFRELVSISIASATATNTSRVALSLQGDGTAGDLFAGARSTDAEAQKSVLADANLAVGTWAHVAAVYDFAGNSIKVYVNGALVATNAAAGFSAAATPNTASRSLALGAQDTGDSNFYQGAMDEVRIYRRALSAAEVQALAQADALQARFALDEGTGTSTADASENVLTGTLRNGASWIPGVTGSAVHFDGTNDSVDLGANLPLLRNVNAASVAAWIRPGSAIPTGAFRELVSISVNSGSPTNTSRLALSLQGDGSGGDLFLGGRSTDTETQKSLVANADLAVGTWVHVAGVVDFAQGTITIYRNGELVATGPAAFTQSHTPNTAAAVGALGAQDTGDSNFFQGDLDEVRVYGRALTACEVSELALKDGLHLHLKMNEGSGTTTADASGHGTNGTLQNGVAWGTGQFGQGLSFDGANDYVSLGSNLDMLKSAEGATLTTWVKPASIPASGVYRDLISISVNSTTGPTDTSRAVLSLVGDGTAMDVFAGGRSTDTESQQTLTANANIGTGVWVHLAAVIDYTHNTLAVYRNGALVGSKAVTFAQPISPATVSTNAALGAQDKGDGNFYHGLMDEVRVYCRPLAAGEIAVLALGSLPVAPTLTKAEGGDQRVDLQWTAVAGATGYNVKRRLTSGGTLASIGNVGNTTFADLAVVNGTSYTYAVSAQNLVGEGPDSNTLPATPNPPATLPPPVIVSPVGPINTATPTVNGTSSTSGLTITVYIDNAAVGTTTSVVAGNWAFVPVNPLSDGPHTLKATASNATQTTGFSNIVAITVDTVAPGISSPFPPDGSTIFTTTPLVSASWSDVGTGIDLTKAVLTIDGQAAPSPTLSPTGFSYTPTLTAGPHTAFASIKDLAGNAHSLTWGFNVLVAPPSPVLTSPVNGALLSVNTPTVSGTSSTSGLGIALLVDGNQAGATTSGGGGAWSLVPSTPLSEGLHALRATSTNAAGTSAPSSPPVNVTIDTLPPLVFNPSPSNGSTISVATPVISASWSDATSGVNFSGAVIKLDGQTVAGASRSATGFSFGAPTLSAALHTVLVVVADNAGNGTSFSWSFTVSAGAQDTIAPVITGLDPANGAFVKVKRPPMSASVSDSGGSGLASVVLKLDGTAQPATVTFSSTSAATVTFTPSTDLTEGSHVLTIEAKDGVNNASSAASNFTVDSIPPVVLASVAPTDPLQGAKTVTVSFSDPFLTSSSRKVLIDLVDRTAQGTFSGNTWTFGSTFAVGTHSVVGQALDTAGNLGQGTVTFEVQSPPAQDTRPPTVTLVYPDFSLDIPPGSTIQVLVQAKDQETGDTGIATVNLLLNGSVSQTKTAAQALGGSYYAFTVTFPLTPQTNFTVSARATDQAGNTATSESRNVHLFNIFGNIQSIQVQAPASVGTGETFNVTATLKNGSGNPSPTDTALRVRSTLASTPQTVNVDNVSQVTFPYSIQGTGFGVLEVTDFFGTGSIGTSVIQVLPGAPSEVTVEFFRTERLSPGKTLSEIKATVKDSGHNPIANATVTWTVSFSQNGSPIGQQTLTATTDANGVAQVPSVVVPENSTQVTAGASVPTGGGTATGSSSSPVVPNVIFNIAFQHQAVEAGVPLSFMIAAINPETGAVVTDFADTVYVYRYNKRVHGAVSVDGSPVTDGDKITVTFTADDQGVKMVNDGIILTERGETVLVASTEAPNWKHLFTDDPFEWNEFTTPFASIGVEELTDAQSTIGGYSNELVVLASRPAHFVGLSVNVFPPTAIAILVDRFDNPVFLEPVGFSFKVNSGTPTTYTSSTDIAGFATGHGATNLDTTQDNTVTVTVKASRYPASDPNGVPEVSESRFLPKQDDSFSSEYLSVGSPTVIELGQDDQDVPDASIEEKGKSRTPTFSVSFTYSINDQAQGGAGISISAATFESTDSDLQGSLDIQTTSVSGVIKNKVPLNIPVDQFGNPIPTPFDLHFKLKLMTVDVPDDGRIPARHPDGRLTAGTSRGYDVRTVAFFGKTLNFIGSVIPAGNDHLTDSSGNKPAGVYIIDAGEVRRTMINNPGLIPQNPSGHSAGTFRVQVMDKDLSVSDQLVIRLESQTADGQPITDPVTHGSQSGTTVDVPLQTESSRDASDPDTTFSNSLVTKPVVAVDRSFLADASIGGSLEKVQITSQSSVPSDGQTKARIDVVVRFEDGTPAPGASITLEEDEPKLPQPPTITQPSATDSQGKAQGFVKSAVPGTVRLKANVSVPSLDADHPGFTVTDAPPLKILFFDDVRTLVVVPGGKIKATLYQGTSIASGFSSKVKEAVALGVEIRVKPEGEGSFRSADGAMFTGTSPKVEFSFKPNIDVFSIPDPSDPPPFVAGTDPNLLQPLHRAAIVVDCGDDGAPVLRAPDPNLRIVTPDLDPWKDQFTKLGDTLTWSPSSSNSPFGIGANRIRIVTFQSGPAISSAHALIYEDDQSILISPLIGTDSTAYETTAGDERFIRGSHIVFFKSGVSDVAISEVLGRYRIHPVGLLRSVNALETFDPAGRDADALAAALVGEPSVQCAFKNMTGTASVFASESIPDSFRVGGQYEPSTGGFINLPIPTGGDHSRQGLHRVWPYHVMDVFPAHRLAERTAVQASRASLSVVDQGFGPREGKNTFFQMFQDASRLGSMLDAGGGSGFINPNPPGAKNAWRPSPVEDLNSPVMRDFDPRPIGHGTGMAVLAAGDGSGARGGQILGTGVHVDRVNFVQVITDKSADLAPLQIHIPQPPPGAGLPPPDVQLNSDTFRILGALLFESRQDPRPDVLSVSLAAKKSATNPQHQRQAVLGAELILDEISRQNNGVIMAISAGNDAAEVFELLPAALAPVRGTRKDSSDNDSANHTETTVKTAPDSISSPLVVAISATQMTNLAGNASESFAQSWGGGKGSNHGRRISVAAPGTDIVLFGKESKVHKATGTSPAGALVAGVLGEMVRMDRGIKGDPNPGRRRTLIRYLEATSDFLGTVAEKNDDNFGYGRVNQWKALLAVLNDGIPAENVRVGFTDTDIRKVQENQTNWYGFRPQTRVRSASFVMGPANNRQPVVDSPAASFYPTSADGLASAPFAWSGTPLQSQVPNNTLTMVTGETGLASNGFFSSRFSASRDLVAPPTGIFQAFGPGETVPYYSLVLNTTALREPAQSGPNVQFSNFVFTISIPKAVGTISYNDGTANKTATVREGKTPVITLPVGNQANLSIKLTALLTGASLSNRAVTVTGGASLTISNVTPNTLADGTLTARIDKTAAVPSDNLAAGTITVTVSGVGGATVPETMIFQVTAKDP